MSHWRKKLVLSGHRVQAAIGESPKTTWTVNSVIWRDGGGCPLKEGLNYCMNYGLDSGLPFQLGGFVSKAGLRYGAL